MGRLILLLLVGAVMVLFVSCGEDPRPSSDSSREKDEAEKKEKSEEKQKKAEAEKQRRVGPVGDYYGQRMVFTTSIECYSFAPNGEVELRHSGRPQVNLTGVYRDGQIFWNSEKVPSKVIGNGNEIRIDNAPMVKIHSCLNPP
jgi:hypothetical protein